MPGIEQDGLIYNIDLDTFVCQRPEVITFLEAGETFTAPCRCAVVSLDVERSESDEDEHSKDEQRMEIDTDHVDSDSEGSVSEITKDAGNGDDGVIDEN